MDESTREVPQESVETAETKVALTDEEPDYSAIFGGETKATQPASTDTPSADDSDTETDTEESDEKDTDATPSEESETAEESDADPEPGSGGETTDITEKDISRVLARYKNDPTLLAKAVAEKDRFIGRLSNRFNQQSGSNTPSTGDDDSPGDTTGDEDTANTRTTQQQQAQLNTDDSDDDGDSEDTPPPGLYATADGFEVRLGEDGVYEYTAKGWAAVRQRFKEAYPDDEDLALAEYEQFRDGERDRVQGERWQKAQAEQQAAQSAIAAAASRHETEAKAAADNLAKRIGKDYPEDVARALAARYEAAGREFLRAALTDPRLSAWAQTPGAAQTAVQAAYMDAWNSGDIDAHVQEAESVLRSPVNNGNGVRRGSAAVAVEGASETAAGAPREPAVRDNGLTEAEEQQRAKLGWSVDEFKRYAKKDYSFL